MQTAVTILAHALRMLIFEVHTTLRILLPALFLVLGSSIAAVVLVGDSLGRIRRMTPETMMPSGGEALLLLVFGIAGVAGYVLMAVLWHRHVLLSGMNEEGVARPSPSVVLSYMGRALLVGLVQMLVAVPIIFGMGVLVRAGGGGEAAVALAGILGGICFTWIALRISLILPAAAVEARMTLADSWDATRSLASNLWGVALLLTGISLLIQALTGFVLPDRAGIAFILQTALFVVEGLVFVSVLTTLYGHIVEGRTLG